MTEIQLDALEAYCVSAESRGDIGEVIVADMLRSKCHMDVLRNVYLPYNGHLAEIDIVAFSRVGVFVVEVKNYHGDITGDIRDKYWKVEYGVDSYGLYNPIRQNMVHKDLLKELLEENGWKNVPIFTPVIFTDMAKLNITNAEKRVFNVNEFQEKFNGVDIQIITEQQMIEMRQLVKRFSSEDMQMKLLHQLLLLKTRQNKSNNQESALPKEFYIQ